MNYWKIYSRYSKESKKKLDFADVCYSNNIIALGWNEVGNLNRYDSNNKENHEKLKRKLAKVYNKKLKNYSRKFGSYSSSLLSFAFDLKINDIILCPSKTGIVYVGRVGNNSEYYYDNNEVIEGNCDFAHRRSINWFKILKKEELGFIWPNNEFGGHQTVSKIEKNLRKLSHYLSGKIKLVKTNKRSRGNPNWKPDKEWGREVELRAMKWLKEQHYKPVDVSEKCKGWDIECGDIYFEVKGRKNKRTTIRLTKNEFEASKIYKKKYNLLIFTASSKKQLEKTEPVRYPNPSKTLDWKVIYEPQYLLKHI